jgi:hypothetical protein
VRIQHIFLDHAPAHSIQYPSSNCIVSSVINVSKIFTRVLILSPNLTSHERQLLCGADQNPNGCLFKTSDHLTLRIHFYHVGDYEHGLTSYRQAK